MASVTPLPEDLEEAGPPAPPPPKGFHWYWLIPIGLGVLLLYAARDIITPFVIGVVLAYLLDPFVATIHRYTKLPRTFVVIMMALLTLALFGGVITLLVRLTANEGQQFVKELPGYLDKTIDNINQLINPTTIKIPKDAIPGLGGNGLANINVGEVLSVAVSFATSTGQGLLDFLITFVSTVYLLLDGHSLFNGLQRFTPPRERPRLNKVMRKVRETWSSYIRAQIILAALMAFVSWIVLQFIFDLPFALPVALAIGLLETVPIAGPLVALALAGVVSLATGGLLQTLFVILALYVLRLVEDNVVIPYVLGHAIHLPAIVTLFSVTVGGIIGGLVGLLLAVPIAAAAKVVLDEYYPHPNLQPGEEAPHLRPRKPLPKVRRRRATSATDALAASNGALESVAGDLPKSAPATTHLPESESASAGGEQTEHTAASVEVAVLDQPAKEPGKRSRKKTGPSGDTTGE
ncbi:MAG TPA: AI-2E family transporter [Ktedonobacterales bacterium]